LRLAAVDKAIVVVEADPNTLLDVEGSVIVLFPVASCVTINVPYEPTAGVDAKLKVLFPPKVTLAFSPFEGFQLKSLHHPLTLVA
jgi:hypothetical protein